MKRDLDSELKEFGVVVDDNDIAKMHILASLKWKQHKDSAEAYNLNHDQAVS